MQTPGEDNLSVTRHHLAPFGGCKPNHHQRRADQHAPDQRIVPSQQAFQQSRHPLPVLQRAIIAFRIIEGIRQALIRVVLEVGPLVTPVRIEDAERRKHQSLVHPCASCRMSMQHLVLEGGVQGNGHAHKHQRDRRRDVIKVIAGRSQRP